MPTKKKLEPLKLSCNNADCSNNLHCFRKSRKLSSYEKGACQYCGAQLVDWPRLHKRELGDVQNTFRSLKYEWIRHHFWEGELSQRVISHARRKGRTGLETAVEKRIRQSVAKPKSQNPYDGRQTPFEGKGQTIITCAQHAVACCCRKCMEYWHGIPNDIPLTDQHVDYFKKLVLMYVDERLPSLKPEPEYVPPLKAR